MGRDRRGSLSVIDPVPSASGWNGDGEECRTRSRLLFLQRQPRGTHFDANTEAWAESSAKNH